MQSIFKQLLSLPDDYTVACGHGRTTTTPASATPIRSSSIGRLGWVAAAESARLHGLLRQLPALARLLDLGCGICADAETYLAAGAQQLCGVDWDWLALRAARRAQRRAALCLIYADLREVAFAPRSFDAILIRHPDVARAPPNLGDGSEERSIVAEKRGQAADHHLQPRRTLRDARFMPVGRRAARCAAG